MIRFDRLTLPAAELGAPNPLPDIMNNTYIHAGYEVTDRVTTAEAENIGRGMISTMLPYLTQDGYTRERRLREVPAIILENRYLRAVFLPSLGGRLWQLYDKVGARDLLYVNPVLQPCNLALRNAWFSGGAEFNVGIKGHNPLTCSPLFAVVSADGEGNEVLSMYEFERIRGVTFSVNAWLPEDSRMLYIRNVIENTAPTETEMYWWTNMAVPQTDRTRILVPADEAFVSFYNADHYVLDSTPIPQAFGRDVSYPAELNRSMDFFYKLPDGAQKWIACADEAGRGLLHFSQSLLRGRKLFLWGQGNGGRHWGEFLAGAAPHSGEGYLEIQAGLARTQLEHFPMPAGSTLAWTECFAALDGSPAALHGTWEEARAEVERVLASCTGGASADAYLSGRFPDLTGLRAKKRLYDGSGWGALENRVRKRLGLSPVSRLFPDWETADTEETAYWHALLDGTVPKEAPLAAPVSYVTDLPCDRGFWADCLKTAVRREPENASLRNRYGVTLYASGRNAEAEDCWRTAAKLGSPYAWRNLAAYHGNVCGQKEAACREITTALELLPESLPLARDYAATLCGTGNAADANAYLERLERFPDAIRRDGRMQLCRVRALLTLGKTEEAAALLTPDFTVPDIREGELSMSALWFEIGARRVAAETGLSLAEAAAIAKAQYPLPYTLDLRMHE